MFYQIVHTTRYSYTSPVNFCRNLVALTPRPDLRVECFSHRLRIKPNPPQTHRRADFFGNQLTVFAIEESHEELSISAVSRVEVRDQQLPASASTLPWPTVGSMIADRSDPNWLAACGFVYDSPRVARGAQFAQYALEAIPPRTSILEALVD